MHVIIVSFKVNTGKYSEPINIEFGHANISIVALNVFNELAVRTFPNIFFFTKTL